MHSESYSAPTPDLRIIPTDAPQAHEEHDSQRSGPLMRNLQASATMTNPPIVTRTDDDLYIVLDGANRCYSFAALGYPHILVQVVSYFSGQVQLETWNHVISRWSLDEFLDALNALDDVEMDEGQDKHAIAHLATPDGRLFALVAPVQSVHERNAALREVVRTYQRNAVLSRTPLSEPDDIWKYYPEATALMLFPGYEPQDIIQAVRYKAYLPPGISRHIVQGRALHVNYPMAVLRDTAASLEEKNEQLKAWMAERLMNRQVRYYAEATYQFNE